MKFDVVLAQQAATKRYTVDLERDGKTWKISVDGQPAEADVVEIAPDILSILLEGQSHEIRLARMPDGQLKLQMGLGEFTAEVRDPRSWQGRHSAHVQTEGRQQVTAPMAGKVVRLLVKSGDPVEIGQGLLVVEAMKMQNEIRSPKSGTVEKLQVREGQAVNAGDVLASIS
jgi:biotin carboxyl carrier protein